MIDPEIQNQAQSLLNTILEGALTLLGLVVAYYMKRAFAVFEKKSEQIAEIKGQEAEDRRRQFAVTMLDGAIRTVVAQVNQTITKRRGPDGKLAEGEATRLKSIASRKILESLKPDDRKRCIEFYGAVQDLLTYVGRRIEAEVYWQKPAPVAPPCEPPIELTEVADGTKTG